MEDINMEEEIEEKPANSPSSPPRKKIKTDGQACRGETSSATSSESLVPNSLRHKIEAHEGGCSSILFLNNSNTLISGGKDSTIKLWDTNNGTLTSSLQGFQGSVNDLAISSDNSLLVAALNSHKLCVWDLNSSHIMKNLTGHEQKVSAVDISRFSSRYIVSAADHIINLWDLKKDSYYPLCGGYFSSHCNALCLTMDDGTVCSGHVNGKINFSTTSRYGRNIMSCVGKIAVHTQPVTSICPLRCGNVVLTSGRDNWHNLVDLRTLQICGKFKTKYNKVASNWSRTCVSPDDNFVAVGSADGSVYIWSMQMGRKVSALREHNAAVLSCSWSGMGRPMASTHDDGTICIWS